MSRNSYKNLSQQDKRKNNRKITKKTIVMQEQQRFEKSTFCRVQCKKSIK